jgi:hypothetical protein
VAPVAKDPVVAATDAPPASTRPVHISAQDDGAARVLPTGLTI